MRARFLFLLTVCLLSFSQCGKKNAEHAEHSTAYTMADLKVHDGLEVTLFASEPMMTNPTNIDIDARGRVWVCEAYNYRMNLNLGNPTKAEGDRILILEDTDGDGKADKQKVFYQGPEINAALGVCVLGDKVIVSCSPNVYMFTDADGDDVPEKKEILFQGIQGEQHDHGIHSFSFGHDGRLYFAMGNEGKTLVDAKGDTVVDIHGRPVVPDRNPFQEGLVVRTDLNGGHVEVVGHNFRNNYEPAIDPYGSIWQSDNDDDGNKGTRINFVMEFGNYGYKDEITGAGWRARRTNLEPEIPKRHWHLNDPGVVPNLLQTGSGSPSGMTMYEGTLLPEVFRGQMIHAEPGHNVVRAYPVEKDGAGYKATIVNILEGREDQWFRPIDVAVAPDGSLFVADWYDPGVGGHQVGDLERGRIYRIAPKGAKYNVSAADISTADAAVQALLSPNPATRYLAYTSLMAMGSEAEPALTNVWRTGESRQRAQVLWLLAGLGNGDAFLAEAAKDEDSDIRITAIRAARRDGKDVLPLITPLAADPSPQVRREVAVALRGNNTPEAASLWAKLAGGYDGKDRWYLEALGIAAEGNWDLYLTTWNDQLRAEDKNTPAYADIVWRSRSKQALPVLARLIQESDDDEMLRYFRAFDFHNDASKNAILTGLALNSDGEKAMYALKHLDATKTTVTPALLAKLNGVLNEYEGKIEFVEMINAFDLRAKAPQLLDLGIALPDSLAGKEAIKTLTRWNRYDLFEKIMTSGDEKKMLALTKALQPQMNETRIIDLMTKTMADKNAPMAVRKATLKNFNGSWEAEDRLLAMAKENQIPEDLLPTAGAVFQNVWRAGVRQEAAKYVSLPGTKDGASLPDIAVLIKKKGDVAHGEEVFNTLCSNCHQVNGKGTDFGPGLTEIGSKLSRPAMYKAILYPDQGISFGFEGFRFKMKDGSEAFGMITSQTENEITVRYMNNSQVIERAQIESTIALENSLMPGNLQAAMSEQDLVDLVEYLMSLQGKQAGL